MKNTKEVLKSYLINKRFESELIRDYKLKKNSSEELNNITKELRFISQNNKLIEDCIMSLSQPSKIILSYRYLKNLSYEMIALRLNYSTQRIYQLLKIAHNEFEKEYFKRTKMIGLNY